MSAPYVCPHCKEDLSYDGPGSKPGRRYTRMEGWENPDVYDGILVWRCPECGAYTNKWPEGHQLHVAAETFIRQAQIRPVPKAHSDPPRPVLPRRDDLRSDPAGGTCGETPPRETP
jgi:hypothetical protein